jgi:hypothetical protein
VDFDPFGDTSFADEPIIEAEKPVKPEVKKNTKPTSAGVNPLAQTLSAAETKDAEEIQRNLFAKPPVFSYAAAHEEIEDTTKTFEELRIEKSADFPELEDGKRVSWTVEYGKITKIVSNPKSMTITKMKTDIETAKEFFDALKKAKDKEPVCKLIPKITAQTKSKIPAYKGVFPTVEDAVASDKIITYFPAKDGKVYEMRINEAGRFITPSHGSDLLSEVSAGFIPALPPIPYRLLLKIISFFRMMALKGDYEALVNVYWDKETHAFVIDAPSQTVTSFSVNSRRNQKYDDDRYIHYLDIHSHNKMKAFFSEIDNNDEKATRVYAVVGNVLDYFPQIKVRISNGGVFHEIAPAVIFEDYNDQADLTLLWQGQVKTTDVTSNNTESGDGE